MARDFSVHAEQREVSGEVTPYLWLAGLAGDATVAGNDVDVDYGCSDLYDLTDFALSALGVVQYGQIVVWAQMDYMDLSSDGADNPPPNAELESETTITTLAVGYQFKGNKGKTYDVLVGMRNFSMDNTLTVDGVGKFEKDFDINDTVLVFRPSLPINDKWRFNPTISYGSGDSEATYELWPQFQYKVSDKIAVRLGYRTLHYEIEGKNGNKWDGGQAGLVIGVGGMWY